MGEIFYGEFAGGKEEIHEKFLDFYTKTNRSLVVSDLVNKCLESVGYTNFSKEVEEKRQAGGGRKTRKKRNLTKRRKSKNKTMVKSNRRKLR